jgi:SHS2 domain-containing protein
MNTTRPDDRHAGFEPVEHTADIGLRVWGRSLEEMFHQAAIGLISLLVRLKKAPDESATTRTVDRHDVAIEAADAEEALISWLQEILYLFEVEKFIPSAVEVQRADASGVLAHLTGAPFDPMHHEFRTDIKAATYHNLEIRKRTAEDGAVRWESVIIFDI